MDRFTNVRSMGDKAVYILLDEELKTLLQDVLYKERKSLKEWLHEQAQEYVKRHGAGNPAAPLTKWLQNPQYVACPTILEAEGFNWASFSQQDLGRFQLILARELARIQNTRRQRREKA